METTTETKGLQQSSMTRGGEPESVSEIISKIKEVTNTPSKFVKEIICNECAKNFTFQSDREYSEYQLPKFCETCTRTKRETEAIAFRENRWREICPPLYLNNDPAKLPDEEARKSFAKIQEYNFDGRGLVVHGLTRRGKTRAVWQRLKKAYMNTGMELKFAFGGMFSLLIAESFEEHDTTKIVRSFGVAPIVFFDDIGQMIFTERVQECLFTILESRCAYMKPTVFTMNDIGNTLKEKFSGNRGEAFVSRLKEFCEIIKF